MWTVSLVACTIPAISAPPAMGAPALARFENVPANPFTLPSCFRGAELFKMRLTPPITTGPMHPRPTAKTDMRNHVSA